MLPCSRFFNSHIVESYSCQLQFYKTDNQLKFNSYSRIKHKKQNIKILINKNFHPSWACVFSIDKCQVETTNNHIINWFYAYVIKNIFRFHINYIKKYFDFIILQKLSIEKYSLPDLWINYLRFSEIESITRIFDISN